MNHAHEQKSKLKGQLPIFIGVVISLITVGGSVWSSKIAASAQTTRDLGVVKTDIAVLQKSDSVQEDEIKSLSEKLDLINQNLIQLLIANGIKPMK